MPLSKARQADYMRKHRKQLKLAATLSNLRYNKKPPKPIVIPNLDADGNLIPDFW